MASRRMKGGYGEKSPMTDDKPGWKPKEDEAALKALILDTIHAAGPIAPDALPSKVKERLKGRVAGDIDVDAYIKQVLAELNKRRM